MKRLPALFLSLSVYLALVYSVQAMPSYDDVLLVVKSGDAASLEVANYFKAARHIPDVNVVSVPFPSGIGAYDRGSIADRDTFCAAVENHMITNGLASKINYVVLSRGFPLEVLDNAGGTQWCFLDYYLMYYLAGKTNIFTNNSYAFARKTNYNDRVNIKFTRQKYGYYAVSRIDGPGIQQIKELIDGSGAIAYDQYKTGIKYVYETGNPTYASTFATGSTFRTELEGRGVTVTRYLATAPTAVPPGNGAIHSISDMAFAQLDWVTSANGSGQGGTYEHTTFLNIFKKLSFKPGSFMSMFRSFGVRNVGHVYMGGLKVYNQGSGTTGTVTSLMKTDGSDLKLRQQNAIALDPALNQLWVATGVNPWIKPNNFPSKDVTTNEIENLIGNGVVVYDKSGNIIHHFTKASTNGGLLSDNVTIIKHDAYNKRIWAGTYMGVCYYDLLTNTWNSANGLTHATNAPVECIYIDDTTAGQKIYATFHGGVVYINMGLSPGLNSRVVYEYNVASNAVSNKIWINATLMGTDPAPVSNRWEGFSVVKTDPNTLWMNLCWNFPRIIKVNLSAPTIKLLDINLTNINGVDYSQSNNMYNYISDMVVGKGETIPYVYVPVGNTNTATRFGGVLRINPTDDSFQLWGSSTWASGSSYDPTGSDPRPFHVYINPLDPGACYLLSRPRFFSHWRGARLIRFNAANPAGVEWTRDGGGSLGPHNSMAYDTMVNDLTFDNLQWNRVYFVNSQPQAGEQESLYPFFDDGLTAAMGGASHDMSYFDGVYFSTSVNTADMISNTGKDYYLYNTTNLSATWDITAPVAVRLLDGYYMSEAWTGVRPSIVTTGGGGYVGHIFILDPKMAPYAPRVDFTSASPVTYSAGAWQMSLGLTSPGLPAADNTFLASTINANTVTLKNSANATIGLQSIHYSMVGNTISVSTSQPLPAGSYYLTLKCGVDGIKNSKGASLVNTRADEFSEEVTITYSVDDTDGDGMPDAWESANGLNPTVNDASTDLAGDGLPNLIKYALGLSPAVGGDGGHLDFGTIQIEGSDYLTFTFTRPEPPPSDISYLVQQSADLRPASWTSAGLVEVSNTLNGGLRTIIVRSTTPLTSTTRDFMRLKVTHP